MKNMLAIALLVLIASMGNAIAEESNQAAGRMASPTGQDPLSGKAERYCEKTGSNIWECYDCKESESELATICEYSTEDDDGNPIPVTRDPKSVLKLQP